MTIASDIIATASRTLFDTTNVRWPVTELLNYLNDGQQSIVMLRPDANSQNEVVKLVGGTRQLIPATGIRLLRVMRNMGADGATPGRAIRECSREALDNEVPDWHSAQAANVAQHFVFDNLDPKHYYIYPPVAGVQGVVQDDYNIEIIYSASPAKISDPDDAIGLGDQYGPALTDYVLYRAFTKDSNYAGNQQRAMQHLQAFSNMLQVNMKIEYSSTAPADPAVGKND